MHVGGRGSDDIDAGGVLPEFTGTLMRDGYTGYTHLPAVHAWCAAHLLRDLRALSDADPVGQLWAQAMADTLLDANQAAHQARAAGADQLDPVTLKRSATTTWALWPKAAPTTTAIAVPSQPKPAD
jgi:transposase